jgi:hypothetical protein
LYRNFAQKTRFFEKKMKKIKKKFFFATSPPLRRYIRPEPEPGRQTAENKRGLTLVIFTLAD